MAGPYDSSAFVSDENKRKAVFVAKMWQDGKLVSQRVTPFVANKHLELRRPGLKVQSHAEGKTLCLDVSAHSLARFVELPIDDTDAVFRNNYFDVPAETAVTMTTSLAENRVQAYARTLFSGFSKLLRDLLMTDDTMGHIGFFQICDLFLSQL